MAFNIPTQTLGEVFQNQYPFHIPRYQRGYAWEQEEVADLLKDVAVLGGAQGPKSPHFMGGLVHVHLQAANPVSRIHEVVDGQQRMATFSLLMAAVAHGIGALRADAKNPAGRQGCDSYREEIEEAYLYYKETVHGKRMPRPKLVMSRVDEQFFSELIAENQPTPSRETHRRILQAYTKFRRDLVDPIVGDKAATVQARLKRLTQTAKLVADNFFVIHIVSQSRREAYRLFSVLNDRGRNLSDGDLMRARTLELSEADPKIQIQIEAAWDQILDGSEEEIDKFFKAYYPSTLGKRAPSNGLFDAYESAYLNGKSAGDVLSFVKQLRVEKPIFDALSKGLWPFPQGSSVATNWDHDRLERLVSVLRHEAGHPLLLSATKLGEKKFVAIVRVLERFVFRYISVVGAHPSPLYVPYYAEAVAMRSAPVTYSQDSLRKKLKELLDTRAPSQQFVEALKTRLQYSDDAARNRLIKHFLTTIEAYHVSADQGKTGKKLVPNEMTVFDLASTTLEHLYPQNANAVDLDLALEREKHRLGNLTVLAGSDNSTIGNSPFAAKKAILKGSSVTLNRELAKLPTWSTGTLAKREKRLSDLALVVFGL